MMTTGDTLPGPGGSAEDAVEADILVAMPDGRARRPVVRAIVDEAGMVVFVEIAFPEPGR